MKNLHITILLLFCMLLCSVILNGCFQVKEDDPDGVTLIVNAQEIELGNFVKEGETHTFKNSGAVDTFQVTVKLIKKAVNRATVKITCADGSSIELSVPFDGSLVNTGCVTVKGKKIFVKIKV